MMLQLNPPIPVECPKGKGYALFLIDYSQEHNLMWVIALDESGEIWTYQNPEVRMQRNITLGRTLLSDLHQENLVSTFSENSTGYSGNRCVGGF